MNFNIQNGLYNSRWLSKVCYLLKTGQVTSYHADDDGDLKLGLDHNYEILTTGQYAGTTNIVINGKTHALSNNCVRDHNVKINGNKLMWARYVPNADIGPDSNGKLLWIDAANDEDIWAFAEQARVNNLGGHNDWRLPNCRELNSIVDISHCNPVIDTTAFPSTPSDSCWSASTPPCNSATAFYVNFSYALATNSNKSTSKFYVRLVRS